MEVYRRFLSFLLLLILMYSFNYTVIFVSIGKKTLGLTSANVNLVKTETTFFRFTHP